MWRRVFIVSPMRTSRKSSSTLELIGRKCVFECCLRDNISFRFFRFIGSRNFYQADASSKQKQAKAKRASHAKLSTLFKLVTVGRRTICWTGGGGSAREISRTRRLPLDNFIGTRPPSTLRARHIIVCMFCEFSFTRARRKQKVFPSADVGPSNAFVILRMLSESRFYSPRRLSIHVDVYAERRLSFL